MENTTEYYTPELNEFYVGFEYEHKESFFDGTVKKKLQFENSNWIKEKFEISSFSYIERALNGKNAINFLCGIRVKKLSRECIESLGWKKINYKEESSENKELKEWKFIYNNTFLILTIVNDIQKNV